MKYCDEYFISLFNQIATYFFYFTISVQLQQFAEFKKKNLSPFQSGFNSLFISLSVRLQHFAGSLISLFQSGCNILLDILIFISPFQSGCNILLDILFHCFNQVATFCWIFYFTVSIRLQHFVGYFISLFQSGCNILLDILFHCFNQVATFCWICYFTVSIRLQHFAGSAGHTESQTQWPVPSTGS